MSKTDHEVALKATIEELEMAHTLKLSELSAQIEDMNSQIEQLDEELKKASSTRRPSGLAAATSSTKSKVVSKATNGAPTTASSTKSTVVSKFGKAPAPVVASSTQVLYEDEFL